MISEVSTASTVSTCHLTFGLGYICPPFLFSGSMENAGPGSVENTGCGKYGVYCKTQSLTGKRGV